MNNRDPFIYAIIRVNYKTFMNIPHELNKMGLSDQVKAITPYVSILQKTYKGVNNFKHIPILFNYGFLKMRKSKIFNRDFTNQIVNDIPSIISWVHDTDTLHQRKVKKRIDTKEFFDDYSQIALVNRDKVRELIKAGKRNHIYDHNDIISLEIGTIITLKGYPYEGVLATVLDINIGKKTVKVNINNPLISIILDLSFDNIFYTIYDDMDCDYVLSDKNTTT